MFAIVFLCLSISNISTISKAFAADETFYQLRSLFEQGTPIGAASLTSTLDEQLQLNRDWHCLTVFEQNIPKVWRYEIPLRNFRRFGELIVDGAKGSGKLFVFDASRTFVGLGGVEVNTTNLYSKKLPGEGINEFPRLTEHGDLIFERVNTTKDSGTASIARKGFNVDAYTFCK